MSSKVILPDDSQPVSPVVWRQVGPARVARAASEPVPDPAACMAQMELQYQQKVREAHAAGVREGETAGRNRAAAEFQPAVERLARSIQGIANLRARLRREAEADVVQLALAIARRVVRRELSADPDALRGLVMAALEKLQGQEISRVKVHPSHVSMVKSCLQQALSGGQVEVLPDPSREPGSVIFETTRGNLDASVDSQLQEIERGLTDRLRTQS
jgi:flagellar assembly protein FliH